MGGEHRQLKGARPATPHTNRKGGYNSGEHLVVCDRSGKIYDSTNVRKEWNGLIVGRDEWEPRHPQEFRRGIREDIAVREARPGGAKTVNLATTIDDITPVSGSVVASVYTSAALDETRPFVFWTLDLGAAFDLTVVKLEGLALSGAAPAPIRRGVKFGISDDDVIYTDLDPAIGAFSDGLQPAGATHIVTINAQARYLRLAMIGGKGFGYTGELSMTGLTVTRDV